LDAPLAKAGTPGLAVVRLVGVHGPLVALDEVVSRDAVVDIGRGHRRLADQPAALVDRGVRLVAEPALAILPGPASLSSWSSQPAGHGSRPRPHRPPAAAPRPRGWWRRSACRGAGSALARPAAGR